ncbi:MAG: acyltransferase [Burkholderiales bacterium]|nr:acyltransferase [Burkholderiales bacterium]
MSDTRADIQALRGIAVLAVLAYHAKLPFAKGGYLGVDVFFVVSGYLITGLIARGIRAGNFSFAQFYWRRAWRLLPAAYCVILACVAAAPWLLTAAEQRDFFKQVVGAVTFTGNIVLWLQTGYFERAAELKPLLHVWSLAIEEQYYLVLPLAMVLVGARRWRVAAVLATLASAVACFALVGSKPGAVFYLLPTRAWELGLGSVAALSLPVPEPTAQPSRWWNIVAVTCLAIIGALMVTPLQAMHPGWATALACLLTTAVVAGGVRWLGRRYGSALLAWFGDRSYSLYLVHWPFFAFLNSANVGGDEFLWWLRLFAMLASIAVAAALYRFVETPLRVIGRHEIRGPRFARLLLASIAVVLAGTVALAVPNDTADYQTRLRVNVGLGPGCDQKDNWKDLPECRAGEGSNAAVVWGDSFAMHWAAGLRAQGVALVQWTRSSCPPVAAVAPIARDGLNAHAARICLGFNGEVMQALTTQGAALPGVVVMASPWGYAAGGFTAMAKGGDAPVPVTPVAVVDALVAQIRALRAAGRRVVLLAPPPSPGFDVGRCIERRQYRLLSFGGTPDCTFSWAESRQRDRAARAFLDAVAARADVAVIDPAPALCDAAKDRCQTERDGAILYRDGGHLSYEGSEWLATRLQLGAAITRLAR